MNLKRSGTQQRDLLRLATKAKLTVLLDEGAARDGVMDEHILAEGTLGDALLDLDVLAGKGAEVRAAAREPREEAPEEARLVNTSGNLTGGDAREAASDQAKTHAAVHELGNAVLELKTPQRLSGIVLGGRERHFWLEEK
eukprot:CAMPEP_0197438376 /NCGR_PEP_ID=MMETSP1175-20131217/5396_1 /TAXON_ID=1003142 /ORGANISM="Triceratium dubium, Strain CCMP147" /LENGTH=139 /DNA_ID=CAMNT_0042968093 /DNA_START=117 /DNA_END=537 /DNA_ORIENTATION=+